MDRLERRYEKLMATYGGRSRGYLHVVRVTKHHYFHDICNA